MRSIDPIDTTLAPPLNPKEDVGQRDMNGVGRWIFTTHKDSYSSTEYWAFGSKKKFDQAHELLDKGLKLLDSMGKELRPASQTYSRKKNWNRELENFKSAVQYGNRRL